MGPPLALMSRKIQTGGDRVLCSDEEVDFRAITCGSLLDSGASLASLYIDDLEEIGIRRDSYGAEGYAIFNTTKGPLNSRLYGLIVMMDGNDGTPTVDCNNPTHRGHSQSLVGGIYLVCEIKSPRIPKRSQEGVSENDRLSGLCRSCHHMYRLHHKTNVCFWERIELALSDI